MIKRMKAEEVIVSEPWRPLPKIETAEALESADLRVLLMVMHHLTGDEKWLSAPFAPQRDVNLISDLDAGLSDEAQRHLKTAALDLLTSETLSPAIHDPGEALMQRMISTCLGEAIPPEYNLMLREEMGFQDRGVDWRCKTAPPPVVIVGAGPSGLITGKRLVDMGVPYIILEKNEEVGGTWFENRYPGCAVDTPNHAYSFSFGRRQDWSRYFSPQSELLSYLVERSHEFGVRDNIRFQHELTGAEWDDKAGRWGCFVRGPDGDYEIEAVALVKRIPVVAGVALELLLHEFSHGGGVVALQLLHRSGDTHAVRLGPLHQRGGGRVHGSRRAGAHAAVPGGAPAAAAE